MKFWGEIGLRNDLVSFRKTAKNLGVQQASAGELLNRLLEEQKATGFVAKGTSKASGP